MASSDPVTSQEVARDRRRAGMMMLGGVLLAAVLRPVLAPYVGSGAATAIVLGSFVLLAIVALRRIATRR